MPFDAAVFDLDGTLLDTIDDLADSMNLALRAVGLPPRSADECKLFVGNGALNFAQRAMAPCDDESLLAEVMKSYRQAYSQRWACKTRPYDGIIDMLDELGKRGVALAVLSNKPDDFTQLAVEKMLPGRFKVVMGARPGVPHKPDPQSALEVASSLGVSPEKCLYVGDTNTDMRTASGAGMYAVGVLWGFRDRQELLDTGARTIISHPMELIPLLDGGERTH